MLMVIFGAGASYDSVPSYPPKSLPPNQSKEVAPPSIATRPPLANELFDDRPLFVDAVRSFPDVQPIVPRLRHFDRDGSLEHALEVLRSEAVEHSQRHRQLAAVQYYLHFSIWECERHWSDKVVRGVTNYKTLLDQIEQWRVVRGERICLVTFNYDRLLEEALPTTVGITIREMGDYIDPSNNYVVIKPHGSVHWAREVEISAADMEPPINDMLKMQDGRLLNAWGVVQEMIDRSESLNISDRYHLVNKHPIAMLRDMVLVPAIAIPVETKNDFACPPDHLQALCEVLPRVTKVLIIGWRAREDHFLSLMWKYVHHDVPVTIVAGAVKEATSIAKQFEAIGFNGRVVSLEGGFTDFVLSRKVEEVLVA